MNKSIYAAAILVILHMPACKKDEPLTNQQLLAGTTIDGKSWSLVEQSLNGNVVAIGECITDDVTTFYLSLEYIFDEGSLKCNSNDPQTISGGWVFEENGTHLLISSGSETTDFEILSLTSVELVLKTRILDLETINKYSPL